MLPFNRHEAADTIDPAETVPSGRFAYLFPQTLVPVGGPENTEMLETLADAMFERGTSADNDRQIPAVFTNLGQRIDHDLNAVTNAENRLIPTCVACDSCLGFP